MGELIIDIPALAFSSALTPAATRVLGRLCSITEGYRIEAPRAELAELVDVPRRTLDRAIRELADYGLIEVDRGEVRLTHRHAKIGRRLLNNNTTDNHQDSDIITPMDDAKSGMTPEMAGSGEEEPKMVDWKSQLDKTAAASSKSCDRDAEARRERSRARKSRASSESALAGRVSATEAKPTEEWSLLDLVTHFAARYREVYPDTGALSPTALVGGKGKGQLSHLRRMLSDPKLEAAESSAAATVKVRELIDHTFDNLERLAVGLKLTGRLTPGVILGFRHALLGDMAGDSPISGDSWATRGKSGDVPDDEPTKEGWE